MPVQSKDKTISLSPNNVVAALSCIRLNDDAKSLLDMIQGSIVVKLDPGAPLPIIQVVNSVTGNPLCPIGEFEKITQYRRHIAAAIKEADKSSTTKERLDKVARLVKLYAGKHTDLPERILQENAPKIIEVELLIKNLMSNIDKIENLGDTNGYKKYLLSCASAINYTLSTELVLLMGPSKYTKEMRADALFGAGVPKWIFGKFVSRDWIKNETKDVRSLIFPKNNFLKGLAFTTKELADTDFFEKNQDVLQFSGHIKALAQTSYVKRLVTNKDKTIEEALQKQLQDFSWTIHEGATAEDLIQPRIDKKSIPVVSFAKVTGTAKEGQLGRLSRELSGKLNYLQQHLALLTHGIVLVNDPIEQFWSKLFTDITWDITPERGIYHLIKDHKEGLTKIGWMNKLSNGGINELIFAVLATKMEVFNEDLHKEFKTEFLEAVKKLTVKKKVAEPLATPPIVLQEHGTNDFNYKAVSDVSGISADDRTKTKKFLGLHTFKKKDVKMRVQTSATLPQTVVDKLHDLTNSGNAEFWAKIESWLKTSFRASQSIVKEKALDIVIAAMDSHTPLDLIDEDPAFDEEDED